jgi:hypothetical protein
MLTVFESIKRDGRLKVLIMMFILLTFWWKLSPGLAKPYEEGFGFQFAYIYFIIALFGGVCGLLAARRSTSGSDLSRAQIFFAIGLLCQVFGQVSYAFYDAVFGAATAYPSIGDIGYFLAIPCYLLGALYLARSAKINIWLQSFENTFHAVMISIVMLVVAFGLFLHGYVFDWSNPLKVFLDLVYPPAQAVYVCIVGLSYLAVQTDQKNPTKNIVFSVLLALIFQFLADYMFTYEVSRGTFVLGGVNDYFYLVTYFIMSFTVLQLDSIGQKSR